MLAAPASATFHLMKIREVYPGSAAAPNSDYVVLQMTASGQNFVNGHEITLYGAGGSLTATITMNATLGAGANQSTILLGGSGYAAAFPGGPGADFSDAALDLSPAGGAVCYPDGVPADCVSWGSFTPPVGGLPSPSAPNASPGGIADGKALTRSISAGCASLLESGDDTNSSAADFSEASPAPRGNATPPSEHACPPASKAADLDHCGAEGQDQGPDPHLPLLLEPGGLPLPLQARPAAVRALQLAQDLRPARLRGPQLPGQGDQGGQHRSFPGRAQLHGGQAPLSPPP